MCEHRRAINCIVPPHMLKAMAESDDPRVRESALQTMLTSARIRGQREVVGALRNAFLINPVGEKHRSIYDARGEFLSETQLPGDLARDEGQPASSDETVNQVYDGLGLTYDLFAKVFGRNSIDGHGMRLVATIHYGDGYNNAFWNGKQMVYGDGDDEVFQSFTRSVDIMGHELTHGITEHLSGLEYHKQSGALNESFSDVFGSLVKQYAKKQNANQADWLIGAGIFAPGINGVALRSMKEPGSAYDDPRLGGRDPQPKHMNDYQDLPDNEFGDFGGVHINSGIPNHAFYLVAQQLGGKTYDGPAGHIWWQTLSQLNVTSKFQDCANITFQVAGARFGTGSIQQQAVKTAWDTVGVRITVPHPIAARAAKRYGAPPQYGADGSELTNQIERLVTELRKAAERLSV